MSAIGIDLGTTYSCVASLRNGKIEIIPNDQGSRVTPSCVSFNENERLIGEAAKEEIAFNFENTLFQIKRLIGRNFDDPSVQEDLKVWGFKLISDINKPKIQVEYKGALKTFYPEEISAMILKELKEAAEAFMGTNITDVVITVPAYFNDAQRRATRDAGRIAGLNVLSVINEPTAAAIAYGFEREENKERNVLIYDVGGGTFDVTVVTIRGREFDVKATGGDTHLGGEDFDNNMVDYFTKLFNRLHNTDMSGNKRAMNRLRVQCEAAKRKLSVSMQAKVQADGLHGGIDFRTTISRAKFEDINSEYFAKTIETVKTTLAEANIDKNMIDDVVLVGGSTRIPKIREMLKKYFNGKELYKTINPDEAVAYGAAALASNLSKDKSAGIKELVLHDIMPLSLGMECGNDAMCVVVKRNTKIPSKHFKSVTTHHDNQTKIRFFVYQGERTSTKYNRLLGSFTLAGILPAPRHVPNIDVCFDIDSSGILTVTAKDEATGNENEIKLDSFKVKLSNEDIEKMINEAEKFKLDDKDFKDRVQSRNKLEDLIRSTKQSVQDLVSKNQLSEEEQISLLKTCDDSLEWMDQNKDVTKHNTDRKLYELERIFHPIFTKIYRGEQNTANEGSGEKRKTKNLSDQFMKQVENAKAGLQLQKERLEGYVSDIKRYIQEPANKERLPNKIYIAIEKTCTELLNWLRSEEVTIALCNDKKRQFDDICGVYIEEMKQEDKAALTELKSYSKTVEQKIKEIENKKEYEEQKNEFVKIKLWMTNNKDAFKPDYDKKKDKLSGIHRNVLAILEKYNLSIHHTNDTNQQRKAKCDLENYAQDIIDYVNHPEENRLVRQKKKALSDECEKVLKWIQLNKNAPAEKYFKKQEQLVEKCGAVIKRMQQEDEEAWKILGNLSKEFAGKVEARTDEKTFQGTKMRHESQEIKKWLKENPKASKPQCEKKRVELQKIMESIEESSALKHKNAPDFEVTIKLNEVQRHCQPILNRLMQNVVLAPPKRNTSLHKDELYNPGNNQENRSAGHSERTFRNEDHMERQNRPGQILNKSDARDRPGYFGTNSTNTKGDRNKFSTYDRPSSSMPDATNDQRKLAIEELRDYVTKVIHELNDDNKMNFLTAKQRGDISGACHGIKYWLSSKSRTLDELRMQKQKLENKCYIVFED